MMVRPVRTHASSVRSAAKKTRGSPNMEAMAWKRIDRLPLITPRNSWRCSCCALLRIAALTALAAVAFASPLAALAQAYPTKPVTIIVPWPPGGPSDIAARPMAKGLHEEIKQTFIIDNRGGAGGNIGSAMVPRPPPTATRC